MTDKKQEKNKWIDSLRRGFTMAELLAVVTIIGILAAFGFVNVYQHQKDLHLTELDDTAREIFTAAQNHLTLANSSGEWKHFLDENENLGTRLVIPPLDAPTGWSDGDHELHYLVVGSDETKELQKLILPSNSIDGTIVPNKLNDSHGIIIEYDKNTATIYAVWYTDGKSGWFGRTDQGYLPSTYEVKKNSVFQVWRNNKKQRRDNHPQIGYYGSGAREQTEGYDDPELTVPDAEIVNTDKLYVKIKFSPDKDNFDERSSDNEKKIYINVRGVTSGNDTGKMEFSKGSIFYLNGDGQEVFNRSSAAYVCYTLDSTTDGAEGHFATKFDSEHTPSHQALIPGEDITVTVSNTNGDEKKLSTTNSLFASIRKDETATSNSTNVNYVAFVKYGRHLQNLSSVASKLNTVDKNRILVTSASLKDDLDWGKFYLTAEIPLERSDENYSIGICDYSTDTQVAGNTGSSALYSIVNNNLTFLDGNHHKIENLQLQREGTGNTVGLIGNNNETGQNLKIWNLTLQNPYLNSNIAAEVTGQNTGFFIGEASNQVGLFNCNVELSELEGNPAILDRSASASEKDNFSSRGNISMFVGKATAGSNLTIRKAAVTIDPSRNITMTSSSLNTGLLVGQAQDNTVNVADADITLNGSLSLTATAGNAGGLIGNDSGTTNIEQINITNAENKQLNITAKGESEAMGQAAILVGRVAGTGKNVTIKNADLTLNGPMTVTSDKENAGGVIGEVSGSNKDLTLSQIHIDLKGKDSAQEEEQSGITASQGNAGGFIGALSADDAGKTVIQDSYLHTEKNFEISGQSNSDENSNGNAGGLIGRASNVNPDIEKISIKVADDVRDTKGITISATTNAGGIIGSISTAAADNNKIENVQYDDGNYGVVKAGSRSAAGFIGRVEGEGLSITDCSTTTYIYMSGDSKNNVGRAGGFIGYINQESGETNINQCYYGGRTDNKAYEKSAGYGSELGYDGKDFHLGGYNIVNKGTTKGKDTAAAGGFIGTAQGGNKSIKISNSYTTGSVYEGDISDGASGGFIGKADDNEGSVNASAAPLLLTNTYCTGEVYTADDKVKIAGAFVGLYSINSESSNNYYLSGINSNMRAAGKANDNAETSTDVETIRRASFVNGDGPITVAEGKRHSAKPYDTSLDSEYPYKFVTDLSGTDSALTEHVGDWPIVKVGESNYAVDNGNKLTFHIAIPADTDDFTMAVEGLADIGSSPRVEYAPFHLVKDANGNITSVQWVNFFQSQWFNWSDGWGKNDKATTCQIAHQESADAFNAAYHRTTGTDYSSDKDEIYFAIDLDDLSKNTIYEAGPFVSLFTRDNRATKLYPGEDICVRVKPGIEKFDISTDKGITANSIYADGSNGTNSGKDAHTALIANSRHLENLNMNLSGIDNYHVSQIHYTKAKQTQDIIWDDDDPSTNDYISDIKNRNNEESVTTYWWNGDKASSQDTFYSVYNADLAEYDGNDKTLKNVHVDMNVAKLRGNEPGAPFQEIAQNGSIHDLTMESVNTSTPASGNISAAGLIGKGNGLTLKNIMITGNSTVTASDYGFAGGIVAELNGTSVLDNCRIEGNPVHISSNGREAGGMIATASGNTTVKNCYIDGDHTSISSAAGSGGLIGSSSGTTSINDNAVKGDIQIISAMPNGNGSSGGAVGKVLNGTLNVTNTLVEGENAVISASGNYEERSSGGLVGATSGGTTLTINNSAASAYIVGQQNAGGLVGQNGGTATITNSYSGGHTSGKEYQDVVDSSSTGRYNVVAQNGYAGGLVGNNTGTLSYDKVFSASSVKSQNSVAGGIFGHSNKTDINSGDISYVIGLVSGSNDGNTGAYTGASDQTFDVGDAYYLSDLYLKKNLKVNATLGNTSGSVASVYFDVENTDEQEKAGRKGVAAKRTDEFAAYTSVYDSALNGYEYPFKVWTSFDFDSPKGRVYIGDWEPAHLKTASDENGNAVGANVIFKYVDPETKSLKDISGSYGKQSITLGKKTTVTLPVAPSFGVADSAGKSYETEGWYLVGDDNSVTNTEVAKASDATAELQQNQQKDLVVAMKYKESSDKNYRVTFRIVNPDDASDVKTVNRTVKSGENVTAPQKDFSGYTFDGWYENDNKVDNSAFSNVTRNITVEAKYQKIEKFTVTIQFLRKDGNTTEQLSRQPYMLNGIKGQKLDQDVTLPTSINSLKPELRTAVVISGNAGTTVTGPTQETNGTRIHIQATDNSIINVFYTGTFSATGKYTIQHIFEDTSETSNYTRGNMSYQSGSTYTYSVTAEQDIGLATGASALDVTGFEAEPFTQEIVKSDKANETVVKIHYKRRSHHVIYRSNGGSYISPATFVYGQTITAPSKAPERKGYNFTGWTYTYRYTKENGEAKILPARSAMPDEDVIAAAQWQGAEKNYRVMYWQENANDDGYSPVTEDTKTKQGITGNSVSLSPDEIDSNKYDGFTYDHNDSEGKVISGDGSTVVNVYYKRNVYKVIFYSSYNRSQLKLSGTTTEEVNANDDWSYFTISQDVTIPQHSNSGDKSYYRVRNWLNGYSYYYVGDRKGNFDSDGSNSRRTIPSQTFDSATQYTSANTALRYYLQANSNEATINYYAVTDKYVLQGTGPIDALTIEAKYGADISEQWPGERRDIDTEYQHSKWFTVTSYNTQRGYYYNTYSPSISQSGLSTMPLGGAEFIYQEEGGNYTFNTVFKGENLSGDDYETIHTDSFRSNNTGWTTTKEDHYAIAGFTFDSQNRNNSAEGSNPDSVGNRTYQWTFYYKRNSYNISFYNGESLLSSDKVKYQADISQKGNESRAKLKSPGEGYTFGGWYQNSELQGDPYDFTGKAMPAGDLVFYAKWIPPVHTVTFNVNAPAGLTGTAPSALEKIEDGKSIEDQMISQGNLSDTYTPKLQNADGSANTEYNFTGWYTDSACTQPFVYASEIHADTTLYAGWEHVAGKRNIAVKYIYRYTENGETTEQNLGQSTVEGDIGQPLTVNAKMDIAGYYPQQTQRTIIVESEDADANQSITFYYNKVQFNWQYQIKYYVLYNNGQSKMLVATSEKLDPTYYQMQLVYGSDEVPVPDALKNYHVVGNNVQMINGEHADENDHLVTAEFDLEADTSTINLSDAEATYDGQNQDLKLNMDFKPLEMSSDKSITYSLETQYGYRKNGSVEYSSKKPVDAGIYPVRGVLEETVTDGSSKNTTTIWESDDNDPVYLTINRRKIVLKSESLTQSSTGRPFYSSGDNAIEIDKSINLKEGEWIIVDSNGNVTGTSQSPSYGLKKVLFAADAFRLNPGTTVNAFDYEVDESHINERNYDIQKEYGQLVAN